MALARDQRRPRFGRACLAILLLAMASAGCLERHPVIESRPARSISGASSSLASFNVKNAGKDGLLTAGVAPLEYRISADRDWLTDHPRVGKMRRGAAEHARGRGRQGLLLVGNNIATITIASNDGPWSIMVRADNDVSTCSDPPTVPWNPAPGDRRDRGADRRGPGVERWRESVSQPHRDLRRLLRHDLAAAVRHDNGGSKSWNPGTLAYATTYYWRIVAKDANGSTSGAEWRFTTAAAPCVTLPAVACTPSPADGATNVNENANLAWGCGSSTCTGLVATYDVYFGTNPAPGPAEFLGNAVSKAWVLPVEAKNTTYYWRIVSKDANGTTSGPVWHFRTRQ